MAARAGTGSGRPEGKLSMRIGHGDERDLCESSSMFGMAGQTGLLLTLSNNILMQDCHGPVPRPGKIDLRMADETFVIHRPAKRFVAACASSDVGMITT